MIPYDTRHLLLCPVCTRGMSLTRDQAARAKALAVSCASWNAGQLTEAEYLGQVNSFWEFLNPLEIADPNAGYAALGQKDPTAGADIGSEGVASGEWRRDPSGRHQYRFWDGSSWTEHVADAGKPAVDAKLTPSTQGWYPDPEQRHAVRYWDGSKWTQHVQDDGEPAIDAVAPGVE
jgi:Protein of unknown function (DUF2510)